MNFQKIIKGMAASVILLGIVACANKSKASASSSSSDTNKEAAVATTPVDLSVFDHSTPSGLKYRILKEGTGKTPTATDVVLVNYEGKLLDGKVFDSSYQRNQPISFPLNGVIKGWTEGLQLMKEGAAYEFYIPYNLAYGERGTPGGPIPPKADLVFVVELLEVK